MLMLLAALAAALGLAAGAQWDPTIDPACCAYPERDPRDFNWPYSHLLYAEVVPDVVGAFVALTELELEYPDGARVSYGEHIAPAAAANTPRVRFDLEPDRDGSSLHTLIAVDPDVPFRDTPTERERCV
ncbi:hypothetical protein T492DRAFT_145973 [Pavlovales sp. CCMP2436]|nr:hypothetical protein T492DRAFT_145973 [Pavlovales sp. CCMP2436]